MKISSVLICAAAAFLTFGCNGAATEADIDAACEHIAELSTSAAEAEGQTEGIADAIREAIMEGCAGALASQEDLKKSDLACITDAEELEALSECEIVPAG